MLLLVPQTLNHLMESTLHVPTPKTPTHRDLSRDDKPRIQILYYTAGWSIDETRLQFPKITPRQIQYALETRPTPQRKGHCGAHALLLIDNTLVFSIVGINFPHQKPHCIYYL
jgi:hypothetical protein